MKKILKITLSFYLGMFFQSVWGSNQNDLIQASAHFFIKYSPQIPKDRLCEVLNYVDTKNSKFMRALFKKSYDISPKICTNITEILLQGRYFNLGITFLDLTNPKNILKIEYISRKKAKFFSHFVLEKREAEKFFDLKLKNLKEVNVCNNFTEYSMTFSQNTDACKKLSKLGAGLVFHSLGEES